MARTACRRLKEDAVQTFVYVLGIVGSGLVVLAYFGNQNQWLPSSDWRYSFLNLAGAVMILASLAVEWNLPAALVEFFWAVISVHALLRQLRRRSSA
jgi:hypothetical protein